ncbi:MAG: putative signal transducing protein [Spirosomataceae bacterium]
MNWTKVFESRNAIRAELVKNELLSNEINSVVLNKQDRNYLFGYHEVLVQEEHAAIAKVIIELFNRPNTDDIEADESI